MNKADRDRARIAELRRVARLAQGREPDQADRSPPPAGSGVSQPAAIQVVAIGPGEAGLTIEEVARRLRLSTRAVEAKIASGEIRGVRIGGLTWMVPFAEVERLEAGE